MEFSFKGLFKKAWESFRSEDNSVLGIDIGSSSIKIVQLKKERERAVLTTYGEIAIGPYAKTSIGQVAKLPEDKVVEALEDVIKEANAKSKNAVVSIPLKASFVTIINLPFTPEKNISEVIQLEARRYIPVSVSEVVLDWWVLPEETREAKEGQKQFVKILLVAIHKDILESYKNVILKARLKEKAYEIESFSMVRSCLGKESMATAVVDLGASTTKLVIVDYGMIKASHSLSQGAQDITIAMSHSMNIDFSRAEELKREIGLSDLPEHKEVVSVIEPTLDYIFSDVKALIKDFQKKNNRPVGKVVLCGGGSLLRGIVDFTVKRFTIEVELADPFSKTEHPVFLASVLKEIGGSFSTAVGLALREL